MKAIADPPTDTSVDNDDRPVDRPNIPAGRRRTRGTGPSITIGLRSALSALVIVALALAVCVLAWNNHSTHAAMDDINARAADDRRAEQTALDYAVGAANLNYQDLAGWHKQLTKGTTPDLTNKLSQAATTMEQIIVPLQWVSTATPLTAKVRSRDNGHDVVDTFVSVVTKSAQAPDGLQSTATYSVTVDRTNWQITDVGGIGAVVGAK